jgi:hypothetical protein
LGGLAGNGAMTGPLYPSYVDFDQFIDVEHLLSLDRLIADRIDAHIKGEQDSFFLNQHRLDDSSPYEPGVREIWLSQTKPGRVYDYLDLDKPALWQATPATDEFGPLMDFVHTLPFAATGRILIIYDNGGNAVPAHRDHVDTDVCNEFIWMRTNLAKRFYVLNPDTGDRKYVDAYSAWFDSVNQYHGADAADGLTFSIRVDGIFSDQFRAQIPYSASHRAAAPAHWAAKVDRDAAAVTVPA